MVKKAWLSAADVPGLTRQEFSNPTRLPWRRQPKIGLLHSTEGWGYPSASVYRNGKSAPHFTIDVQERTCRQHYPLTEGAWALRAVGASTNTMGVIQIEIIGSCDPRSSVTPKVYALTDDELGYLALLVRAISDVCGIPLTSTVKWVAYPASYGTGASQRLSVAAWNKYTGWLGHQHAPGGNSHGDPGNINIGRLLELAGGKKPSPPKGTSKPTPAPKPKVNPYNGSAKQWPYKALKVNGSHKDAEWDRAWRKLMWDVGYRDSSLTNNVEAWLAKLGYYKGIVGDDDWGYMLNNAMQRFLRDKGLYRSLIDSPKTRIFWVARGKKQITAEKQYLNQQRLTYDGAK